MLSLLPIYKESEQLECQLTGNYNDICKGIYKSENILPAFLSKWYEFNGNLTFSNFNLLKLDPDKLANGIEEIIEIIALSLSLLFIEGDSDHIANYIRFSMTDGNFYEGEEGAIYQFQIVTDLLGNFKSDIFILDFSKGLDFDYLVDFDNVRIKDFDNNDIITL